MNTCIYAYMHTRDVCIYKYYKVILDHRNVLISSFVNVLRRIQILQVAVSVSCYKDAIIQYIYTYIYVYIHINIYIHTCVVVSFSLNCPLPFSPGLMRSPAACRMCICVHLLCMAFSLCCALAYLCVTSQRKPVI